MEDKQLLAIIRQIYDLTLDLKQLQQLLTGLLDSAHCRSLGIHIIDRDNLHVISEMDAHADEDNHQAYAEHFDALKKFLPFIREAELGTESRELYCFRCHELRRFEHAADMFSDQLLHPEVFSLIFREGSYLVQMAFIDGVSQENLFHRLLHIVTILRPHVHKAFDIFHTIESLRNRAVGYKQAMDNLHAGVILFDGTGQAVFSNRRAREVIASTPGLMLIGTRIAGPDSVATGKLRSMIRNAVHHGMENEKKLAVTTIPLAEGDIKNISLLALPLHPDIRALVELESGIYAAIVIGIYERSNWMDPEVLQLLYNLTPAEARLAIALSSGKALEECSVEANITLHTARSYLKLIFQKTATRRQAELVALLRSIPVALV
ncbi:helix-turn-helix transcriptional regulator [Mariprofundus sp. KV]|uniref:helix-turn-helix transcriptional regulator n=1 Tax=Mariprofundus sp. KV TaxID=2608715 RepID=UPI0015A433B2|nr:helix-turn-helix transcriptional regulator [Mariprofundus sp. KV]NWF35183.1 helix-turn-helix transcriptional regulator [Mariprofundus sp. KV]